MAVKSKEMDKDEYRQLRDTVYTFFYYSNKPLAASEILLQFKNHKKAIVEKVLADLVAKDKIFVKAPGKSKFYCLAQSMDYQIDDPEYTDEIDAAQDQTEEDKVLRFLKWKQERLAGQLRELVEESKELDARIGGFDNELSDEELRQRIESMQAAVSEAPEQTTTEVVCSEEFEKLKKKHAQLQKEHASRLKIFKNIVGSISEGLEMKPSELLADAGVE